ncbi:DUF3795 domain-containing protein [Chloroflexota bacterium]
MTMEVFQRIREMGREVKKTRRNEEIDYAYMTAPCGLPCFECYLYLAQFDQKMAEMIASALSLSINEVKCKGCRAEDGQCAHLAMECRVYRCIKNTGAKTCAECDDFPCEYLHPYSDQAMKPHNTKVYSLCRIRKVGLEKWAKDEAGSILDKYYYGTWTL